MNRVLRWFTAFLIVEYGGKVFRHIRNATKPNNMYLSRNWKPNPATTTLASDKPAKLPKYSAPQVEFEWEPTIYDQQPIKGDKDNESRNSNL